MMNQSTVIQRITSLTLAGVLVITGLATAPHSLQASQTATGVQLTTGVVAEASISLEDPTFWDVPKTSYAYKAAEYYFGRGVVAQELDGSLGVHDGLTRREAVKLLHSLKPIRLSDKKDNLSRNASQLLRTGADKILTREQAAKLLHFAANLSASKPVELSDVTSVSPFRAFIQSMVNHRLMLPDKRNRFLPRAEITRGQWITMMYRAEQLRLPLTIMYTNDTHGNIQDFARRATAIQQVRAQSENHLLLDAGDVFTGTLYFTKFNGEKDVQLMNLVKYDAMALGNHEFDKSSAVLANFINKSEFAVLSANLDFSKDQDLKQTMGKFAPYTIKSMNGYKVGIFGLTTEMFRETSSPSEQIGIMSAVDSAKQMVNTLQAQGVDKIIALTHLGLYEDQELAKKVPSIDVIVGGHTHDKLDTPLTVNQTLIVQGGQYGEHLGALSISFDFKGQVVPSATTNRLIRLNPDPKVVGESGEIAADPIVQAIIDEAAKEIDAFKNEPVGTSLLELDGVRANVRSKETNLGNLIADSYLAYGKKLKNADLALVNGGGIRASISAGTVTLGHVLTVMPFGNTMGVLDVTGAQLRTAIESGVSRIEFQDGRFPQVAGARYTFDRNKPAMGRVLSLEVEDADGKYVAVDPAKTYRVVTNSFVMKGGDGYEVFNQAKYREDLYIVDFEMFIQYLAANQPVAPQVEGRITVISSE